MQEKVKDHSTPTEQAMLVLIDKVIQWEPAISAQSREIES